MVTMAGVALSNMGAKLGTSALSSEKNGRAALADVCMVNVDVITRQTANIRLTTLFID
jgi:hypothetical protein